MQKGRAVAKQKVGRGEISDISQRVMRGADHQEVKDIGTGNRGQLGIGGKLGHRSEKGGGYRTKGGSIKKRLW